MKKIVHIIVGLNVGGAELMLKRLVLHSAKKNLYEQYVISLTDLGVVGPQLQDEGIKVYSLGMASLSSLPLTFIKLRSLLKKVNPDVVQTWMYHADFIGGLTAKSAGIKNIVWGVRTTDVTQGGSNLTVQLAKICGRLSYKVPTAIVCAAHISKNHHIALGYDKSKMLVIPNGYDMDSICATKLDGYKIREENNLTKDDIIVGSVGRFNPVKNQKLFVQVAAELISVKPSLKFVMVGRDNTVDNKVLTGWLKQYGITKNFRLLGQRDDIAKCFQAFDVFCLHSKTEGFPNVLVEAMANNIPCIATDVGDAKLILQNYGVTSSNNNADELAYCILKMIDKISKNKVQETYSYIRDNFSIENTYNEYAKVWNS